MNNKKSWIIILITIVIIIIMSILPYEQWIFRFDTPQEALSFDYRARVKEIISKVEVENYAYMTYINKSGTLEGRYVQKDYKGWITPMKKMIVANKFKNTFEYSIISYPENNQNLIIISDGSKEKEKLIQKVYDSVGTEFIENTYEHEGVYHKIWIGVIEEYPKDYKIYLDGEEIEL